jgi:DNA-binding CsgD family transcriptional regulator
LCGTYALTSSVCLHYFSNYFAGAYRLDPFYQACWQVGRAGLFHVTEVAPDRFFQSEYYRAYYGRLGLADEVGIVTPLNPSLWLHLSLSRNAAHGHFSRVDIRRLAEIEPVLTPLIARNWRDDHNRRNAPAATLAGEDLIDRILSATTSPSGEQLLTKREAEVTAYVLRGHSSSSIAAILGRSLDTIKVHRRHVYAKLNITSQAELFACLSPALARSSSEPTAMMRPGALKAEPIAE